MAEDSFSAGGSIETAIILLTADSGQVVNEQYRLLRRRFGVSLSDWYPIGRIVVSRGNRIYEKVEIQVGGRVREVYFDITAVRSK